MIWIVVEPTTDVAFVAEVYGPAFTLTDRLVAVCSCLEEEDTLVLDVDSDLGLVG